MAESINQLEKGQKQGFWIEKDGETEWMGYYADGEKKGSWNYLEHQMLRKTALYVNGLRQGHALVLYEDGSPKMDLEFDKDRIHGRVRFFSKDGIYLATYNYVYDKLDEVECRLLHEESPPKDKTFLPEF